MVAEQSNSCISQHVAYTKNNVSSDSARSIVAFVSDYNNYYDLHLTNLGRFQG